jgi:hypothetical protein
VWFARLGESLKYSLWYIIFIYSYIHLGFEVQNFIISTACQGVWLTMMETHYLMTSQQILHMNWSSNSIWKSFIKFKPQRVKGKWTWSVSFHTSCECVCVCVHVCVWARERDKRLRFETCVTQEAVIFAIYALVITSTPQDLAAATDFWGHNLMIEPNSILALLLKNVGRTSMMFLATPIVYTVGINFRGWKFSWLQVNHEN